MQTDTPKPDIPEFRQSELQVNLLHLISTFFLMGTTIFGGMWAATQRIEEELVHKKKWIDSTELKTLLLEATLIPAPKFIGFSALIGFRLKGWLGSIVSVISLILPGSLLVLIGVLLLDPNQLATSLAPLQRAVEIAIIGLLIGNSYHQLSNTGFSMKRKSIGVCLTLFILLMSWAGFPLVVTALLAMIAGAMLMKEDSHG